MAVRICISLEKKVRRSVRGVYNCSGTVLEDQKGGGSGSVRYDDKRYSFERHSSSKTRAGCEEGGGTCMMTVSTYI